MGTCLLRKLSTSVVGVAFIALGTTVAAPSQATTFVDPGQTYGDDMSGMQVTVGFLDGTETAIWDATGPEAGGAFGSDWSLTVSTNTFYSSSANPDGFWTFTNLGRSITSLTIDAIPGDTVFDTIDTLVEPPSTPASARGIPFTVLSGSVPSTFEYSNEIGISAGDLFGTLSLSYANGFTGVMTYVADTDNIINVPEPGSILGLLAVGTLSAGSLLKRRQV